jgi:dihydroorotase
MSKFLSLGMSLAEIVRSTTATPAAAIRRPELGTLAPGGIGDATILAIEEGAFTFHDVLGETIAGERRFAPRGAVIAGQWWHPAEEEIP